jgi:hypothetical protein
MKKPRAHVIDEQAIELFKGSLPKEDWQIYDIKPDYGKDNLVELIEKGSQTGKVFCVQLKGTGSVDRLNNGAISFPLETKHLNYWMHVDIPVFLVLVDVGQNTGYWLFIQRYVRTELDATNWRANAKIRVRLPSSNVLTDHVGLRRAVQDACEYMTHFAFHAAIINEKRQLEELDPRVRVDIEWTPEKRHYLLHSDHPIPLRFSYPEGSPGLGKIDDLLDSGLPVSTSLSEIRIDGSSAFSFLIQQAGDRSLSLQFSRVSKGHVNIIRHTTGGIERGRFDAIPCTISRGRKEARLEARLAEVPDLLGIKLVALLSRGEITSVSMPVNLSAWVGSRLMELPFFDQLSSVFHAYEQGERLTLECYIPGSRVLSGQITFVEQPPYPDVELCISLLQKARAIAQSEGINPVLPGNYNQGPTLKEIDELYAILIGEGRKSMTPDAKVSVSIMREGLTKYLRDSKLQPKIGELRLSGDGEFPFLGTSIKVPQLEQRVSHVTLITDLSEIRKELRRFPRKKDFHLEWAATPLSETILRSKGKNSPIG